MHITLGRYQCTSVYANRSTDTKESYIAHRDSTVNMAKSDSSHEFLYFSQRKDNGLIEFTEENAEVKKMILPRHPDTTELDRYYLQTMLMYFDGESDDCRSNEILDAFPVVSLTKDKNDKFYKLSLERLREFHRGRIKEDEYIRASIKHLFMYREIESPKSYSQFINDPEDLFDGCLEKVNPIMYARDDRDTVDCEDYELGRVASYVPTSTFRRMKLMRGWIEGALHYYDYSIMFFDNRFIGYDDFNENIIDVKSSDLFTAMGKWKRETWVQIKAARRRHFLLNESGLYYDASLRILDLNRKWLYTSPNNDNERDGKVMMFRNNDLKLSLEKTLKSLFRERTFRLNDVFKWNRYDKGGKFDSHFDTMFVKKSSRECSLYTLLLYIEVKGESFMFLGGEDDELRVRLKRHTAYIIPHWVKHRVDGTGMREFIKAEIVFPNKYLGITYDRSLADAFDKSCYYMLQSVRHPQLKDIVSRSFNTINEARFYKTVYLPILENNIFLIKTVDNLQLVYQSAVTFAAGAAIETAGMEKFNYITDGNYYYFKIRARSDGTAPVIAPDEAIVMLSLMRLDIQPKKMFQRHIERCECPHPCVEYHYITSDLDIHETIAYWERHECEAKMDQVLSHIQFPKDFKDVVSVGNIAVPDVHENPDTFYFAACQNIYEVNRYQQTRLTEITAACGRNGNYESLNVELVGQHKNIVKIRQHSFDNGVRIAHRWHPKYAAVDDEEEVKDEYSDNDDQEEEEENEDGQAVTAVREEN